MSRSKKARQATFEVAPEDKTEELVDVGTQPEIEAPAEESVEEPVAEVLADPVEEPVPEPIAEPVKEPEQPAPAPKAKPEPKKVFAGKKSVVICFEGTKQAIIVPVEPSDLREEWAKAKKGGSLKFFKALQSKYKVVPVSNYNGISLTLPIMVGTRPDLGDAEFVELK